MLKLKAPPKKPHKINPAKFDRKERPKERQLQISKSSIQNIKAYTESYDRRMLRDRATQFNLNTAFISFRLTETKDPFNNRVLAENVVAFSFKRLPKDFSGYKEEWQTKSIPLSLLSHSWIPQNLIDCSTKTSIENTYCGYGRITDYTRTDSTQSIGFTKVLPQEEIALRCLYFLYMAQRRQAKLINLLFFGLDLIESFSQVYDSNPKLMEHYLSPYVFADFLIKFDVIEDKAYRMQYPRLKKGASCSTLGFQKHK